MTEFSDVPHQVWEDLVYEIGRNQLDYADNYRAYRWNDEFLKAEYIKATNSGCCGVFESSTIVNGDKWIIGCNHGH